MGSQSNDADEPLTVNEATATVGAASFAPVGPIGLGASVTISASVTGPVGVTAPTGNVQFQVKIGVGSITNFGSPVALSSGSASISYLAQTLTTYQFQATYLGDSNYVSGTVGAASGILTVNKGTASVGASSFVPALVQLLWVVPLRFLQLFLVPLDVLLLHPAMFSSKFRSTVALSLILVL